MSILSIYITVHDQDIVIDYEKSNKFSMLGNNYNYVFVGNRSTDKLNGIRNVIIARDLPDNIENYKYLVDFTAWYAIVKNNIVNSQYISLIQYDTSVSENFFTDTIEKMKQKPHSILGYVPHLMRDRNFIKDNMGFKPLRDSIKYVYNLDIMSLKNSANWKKDKYWPSTNNICLSSEILSDFVSWFTPVAIEIGNVMPAGHAFERAIKFYCLINNIENIYARDTLRHFQLNSHQTQNFNREMSDYSHILTNNELTEAESIFEKIKKTLAGKWK